MDTTPVRKNFTSMLALALFAGWFFGASRLTGYHSPIVTKEWKVIKPEDCKCPITGRPL